MRHSRGGCSRYLGDKIRRAQALSIREIFKRKFRDSAQFTQNHVFTPLHGAFARKLASSKRILRKAAPPPTNPRAFDLNSQPAPALFLVGRSLRSRLEAISPSLRRNQVLCAIDPKYAAEREKK